MKNCPHWAKVKKFLKTSSTSAVLTNPFPNPKTNLVASDHAFPSQVLMLSISKQKNDSLISTRNKYYGNPQMSNNKATYQPTSSSYFNHPSSQVLVELLGNLLDRLNMSEQPSTSRTVSSDTTAVEFPATTPMMFAGIPSVPTSYQSLDGVHPGTVSTTWSIPICSSAVLSGISYVEAQKIDPAYQFQFGQPSLERPIYPLSTRLPPYGGSMLFHCSHLENNRMRAHNKI